MNLEDLPPGGTVEGELARLRFYQRERDKEKREAKRIYEKKRKGEPTSEAEDVFYIVSTYGSRHRWSDVRISQLP